MGMSWLWDFFSLQQNNTMVVNKIVDIFFIRISFDEKKN
jgi:hypothetical protein